MLLHKKLNKHTSFKVIEQSFFLLQNFIFLNLVGVNYGLEELGYLNLVYILVAFFETIVYYGLIIPALHKKNFFKFCFENSVQLGLIFWFFFTVIFYVFFNQSLLISLYGFAYSLVVTFRRFLITNNEKNYNIFLVINLILFSRIYLFFIESDFSTLLVIVSVQLLSFVIYYALANNFINILLNPITNNIKFESIRSGFKNTLMGKGQLITANIFFTTKQTGYFFLLKSLANLGNLGLEYLNLFVLPSFNKNKVVKRKDKKTIFLISTLYFLAPSIFFCDFFYDLVEFFSLSILNNNETKFILAFLFMTIGLNFLKRYYEILILKSKNRLKYNSYLNYSFLAFFSVLLTSAYFQSLIILSISQAFFFIVFLICFKNHANNM